MPSWRHHVETSHGDRKKSLRSSSCAGPSSVSLSSPGAIHTSAEDFPQEGLHLAEPTQSPELCERIINDCQCFKPPSVGWFVTQQKRTRTTGFKLEQVYAPGSSRGLPRLLLILEESNGLFTVSHVSSDAASVLPHVNSYVKLGPNFSAPR